MKSANDSSNDTQTTNSDIKTFYIDVDNKAIPFQASDKNLLECLESADVEVHYHCRDGFCGACRVTLVKGDIHYPQGEPLAFVGDGEILTCCCVPKSDIKLIIE